ncbi:MAG: hypothetical protein HRT95_03695 [Moritella sp.]|uniref:hypothetical protein n=1 Tax=Moritella sp. TaxID=78556 RepID=UPI001D64CCB0|nr:hypothetical protein [Moritella sp.]NQZ49308.1 hypothetical protein [Moritella sp.]
MSEVLATVTFSDGQLKYTKFSTISNSCESELFESIELALNNLPTSEVKAEGVKIDDFDTVTVSVSGFDSWVGIATEKNLVAPIKPFGIMSVNEQFEGVDVERLMHLSKVGPFGLIQCGIELPTKPFNKYFFDESLSVFTNYKEHIFSKSNPFELALQKKLCMHCLLTVDVTNAANH